MSCPTSGILISTIFKILIDDRNIGTHKKVKGKERIRREREKEVEGMNT